MSRRFRIFLALIAVYAIGMAALLYQLLADLDPRNDSGYFCCLEMEIE